MDKKPKKSKILTTKNIIGILADFFEQMILPNFDRIDKKLGEHDKRFDDIDKKFIDIEAHLDNHDRRFDKLDDRLDRHSTMLEKHEKEITSLKLAHLN